MPEEDSANRNTDVDGEDGPEYPLNISVVPACLKVLCPA